MAKEKPLPTAETAGESTSLAERLFAAHWQPGSGYNADHIATQCLEAAETFDRVRRERAGLRIAETA